MYPGLVCTPRLIPSTFFSSGTPSLKKQFSSYMKIIYVSFGEVVKSISLLPLFISLIYCKKVVLP